MKQVGRAIRLVGISGFAALMSTRLAAAASIAGFVRDSSNVGLSGATVNAALNLPMISPLILALLGLGLLAAATIVLKYRGAHHIGRIVALLLLVGAVGFGVQSSSPVRTADIGGDNNWTTTTDPSGHYSLTDLPAGEYGVQALKNGYTVAGVDSLPNTLTLAANTNAVHDFKLKPFNPDTSGTAAACQPPIINSDNSLSPQMASRLGSSQDTRRASALAGHSGASLEWSAAHIMDYTNYASKLVVVPVSMSAEEQRTSPGRNTSVLYVLDKQERVTQTLTMSVVMSTSETPELQGMEFRTPDGKLLGAATFSNGAVVSVTDPDATLSISWSCVAAKLKATWPKIPYWLKWVCGKSCVTCMSVPNPGSCAICVGCLGAYILYLLCVCGLC